MELLAVGDSLQLGQLIIRWQQSSIIMKPIHTTDVMKLELS